MYEDEFDEFEDDEEVEEFGFSFEGETKDYLDGVINDPPLFDDPLSGVTFPDDLNGFDDRHNQN